jgi:GT2 family glycosyltransferase
MKISVIIPTCDGREEEIKKLINSLLKLREDIFEIIVVIDKSEETRKYLTNLRKRYKMIKILFSKERRGRCKAKNEGAKKSRGDILLFLDDDVRILSKNYFDVLAEDFNIHIIGAVSGREIKEKKVSKLKKLISSKVGIITSLGEVISNFDTPIEKPKIVKALPGCNFTVRKDVFEKIGGFDENYDMGTAYREETDLQLRISKLGYKLLFDPRIFVIHEEKESPIGIKKWFKWYYILNTYFFLKNFNPSPLKFCLFIYKEFLGCLTRTVIYKTPYPILYFPNIINGIIYFKKKQMLNEEF